MKHKIVVCPDSFKGSITAADACDAIGRGIKQVLDDAQVVKIPVADGGEGTLEAVAKQYVDVTVSGPYGQRITAQYGVRDGVCVIEMARAAGLTLSSRRECKYATTYGVGQLILHAVENGCRDIMLTVGGSATNDGGCGMAAALGVRFYNKEGHKFVPTGATLCDIEKIDLSDVDPRLYDCRFRALTDVKNPLTGDLGATCVYGRQKGATDSDLLQMEQGMVHFGALLEKISGRAVASVQGSGAGGGLLCPLIAFFEVALSSGIEAVLEILDFENVVRGADMVITGEGRIDVQSLYGKTVSGIVNVCKKQNIPVYCLVGGVSDRQKLTKMGIADILALTDISDDLEYLMKNADALLQQNARKLIDKIYGK